VSWIDWEDAGKQQDLIDFTCALSELRRAHPVFRRRRFFSGQVASGRDLQDIVWLTPAGQQMTDRDWNTGYARSLAVFLNGDAITEPGPRGDIVRDQSFLLLFNANREPVSFTLPDSRYRPGWEVLISTATAAGLAGSPATRTGTSGASGSAGTAAGDGTGAGPAITVQAGRSIDLAGRSIMVLRGIGGGGLASP
jgi:isoamylase